MNVDPQRRRLTVSSVRGGGAAGSVVQQEVTKEVKDLATTVLDQSSSKKGVVYYCTRTDPEKGKKRSFADKEVTVVTVDESGKVDHESSCNPSTPLKDVFAACKKGMKPESPNQDSFTILVSMSEWALYGVFDGHGPNGHDVSDFAHRVLVANFVEKLPLVKEGKKSHEDILKESFVETQERIKLEQAAAKRATGGGQFDATTSGSTCTMAFHDLTTDTLIVAHVGDSRGVLRLVAADGDSSTVDELTEDHKPNLPREKARIESKGGRVIFDGYYNYRVFAKDGMYPGLNMSRALGDTVAHDKAGLTAEPETKILNLRDLRTQRGTDGSKRLTLLLCSDGVWEFIESKDAFEMFDKKAPLNKEAVNELAQSSWDKWMADSDNEISDDISVIAIDL